MSSRLPLARSILNHTLHRPPDDVVPRALTLGFALGIALLTIGSPILAQGQPTAQALELRNQGLAQLENEKNTEAEELYRRLTKLVPNDPLPHANLAVALLRQQKNDQALAAIEKALDLAPGRADLLAIRADVLSWSAKNQEALAAYKQAFAAEPNDPEIVYALYRHAETLRKDSSEAQQAADEALQQMARLRPDNLLVLLLHGQRAIEQADRAAASQAFLRIRELSWALETRNRQLVERVLPQILEALESNEIEKARVPSLQLGNVIKASGRYKSSLVEFYNGIQGIPVARFVNEPSTSPFGNAVDVSFQSTKLSSTAGTGALVVADWNDDTRADVAWARTDGTVEERSSGSDPKRMQSTARTIELIDLDNDVQLDLLLLENDDILRAPGREGSFAAPVDLLVDNLPALSHLAPLDFDSDGDLDLATVRRSKQSGESVLGLYRNDGTGKLSTSVSSALPQTNFSNLSGLVAGDVDRDGDTDIVVLTSDGIKWFDNLRQGAFFDRTRSAGLSRAPGGTAAELGDLDNDGNVDLLIAGAGPLQRSVVALQSTNDILREKARFEARGSITDAILFDADNDGFLDVALATSAGVEVFVRRGQAYRALAVGASGSATEKLLSVAADDADGDGDLDLFAAGPSGLFLYTNEGGNKNGWLRISLRGLTTGNDKNNAFGLGASVAVTAQGARQYREARTPTTHFGLGSQSKPDNLRIVWANGVPQNRLDPEPRQRVVEEQVLKGSCPFLYTYTGEETDIQFVTDLLWGAPIGMPVAEGVYAEADPHELVVVTGAQPRDGFYDLRITEELWEAAYFDLTRLWVVDHPIGSEATGSLRVFPGPAPAKESWPDEVLLAEELRPVQAWDGEGRDVSAVVAARDDTYADGYPVGKYQGISKAWTFTFDLGEAPQQAVRLVLDGWIFPSDASINIAASQRSDLPFTFTRLEVLDGESWKVLIDPMGFPAGKTKTTIVDTPPLPKAASKLRIVTSRWLHWDRIAWSKSMPDDEAIVVAQLEPASAELSYRGFSKLVRKAPNAPHEYDYSTLQPGSPWIPFPGRYTRYGDVREVLTQIDSNLVVMSAGDELKLRFDARTLPKVAEGYQRTLFLESYGWDKDADRNTLDADKAWPLPEGTLDDGGQATEKLLTRVVTRDSR